MDISILLAIQNFRESVGTFLADFMAKMTYFGELPTAIIIMGLIYWCISKADGTYILMGWSGNRIVNGFLKITACAYRPWIRDSRIVPYGNTMSTATGYSFPSGHTMNASAVFGSALFRKKWPAALRCTMVIVMLLVGFSRNFVGVHTPQDVIVGLASGILMMGLVSKLMIWIENNPDKDWIILCVGLVLSVVLCIYASVKDYPRDLDAQGKVLVDGAKMALDSFKGVGYCTGFLFGWILERRFVRFSTDDIPMIQRVTRAVVGLMGFYVVNLILAPQIKGLIGGPAGNLLSCFLPLFYVTFLFPLCLKALEKEPVRS